MNEIERELPVPYQCDNAKCMCHLVGEIQADRNYWRAVARQQDKRISYLESVEEAARKYIEARDESIVHPSMSVAVRATRGNLRQALSKGVE